MAQQADEEERHASAKPVYGDLEVVGTVVAAGNPLLIATDQGDFAVSSLTTTGNRWAMEDKTVKVTATLLPGVEREDGYQVIDVLEITPIE